jgi:hypothetical protein
METKLNGKNEMQNISQYQQIAISEISSVAKAFSESGMFPDIKSAAQAIVKIQAGQELGIKPFAAMTGIHIIAGKPVIGAGIIASRIKASGKYDYRVIEMTDNNCSLDFYQGKEKIGNSSFSVTDAKKTQTKNMDKFPRNMLFARAISNGVKWYSPDVFDGPVYVPEEMNIKTEDAESEIVKTKINDTPISNLPVSSPDPKPFEISGAWLAKVEKWKSIDDIINTYNDNPETINANPELQIFFFKEAVKLCKSKSDVLLIYKSTSETINANPELQNILKESQLSFTNNK